MRCNVDSKALNEPRIRRVAKRLGISHYEVLGRCIHVWMISYERHTEFLPVVDVEIACGELPGFVDAIVTEELADLIDERMVRLRGAEERIAFLDKQTEKGIRSGEVRRAKSAALQQRTTVQQGFMFGSAGSSAIGSTEPGTYSQDQDQDQAPDLDQDHPARAELSRSGDGAATRAGERSGSILGVGAPPVRKMQHRANGERVERAKRGSPEPPPEAVTLAGLLLHLVTTNNPGGRLAKSAERLKDQTTFRWADSIRKLQELDHMQWGEIDGMIRWSQRDPFWRGVILGADNLREQWDQMAVQRNRRPAARPGNEARPGPTELARREVEQLERAQAARGKVPT